MPLGIRGLELSPLLPPSGPALDGLSPNLEEYSSLGQSHPCFLEPLEQSGTFNFIHVLPLNKTQHMVLLSCGSDSQRNILAEHCALTAPNL